MTAKTILAARYKQAMLNIDILIKRNALTFKALEDALVGLTLEQRITIKRSLAAAGQMP